jgi:hypothetical protein
MRRLLVLLALPLIAAGFVACGGDDDSGGAVSTDKGSSSNGSSSGSSFCKKAKAVDEEFNQLDSAFTSNGAPSSDVFEKAADALEKLADDAPSKIKTDMRTVADGVRKVADVLGDIDLSDPQALADPKNAEKLQQMSDEMEGLGQEIQAASDRVGKYLSDECGIDLDSSTTSEPTTSTTSG